MAGRQTEVALRRHDVMEEETNQVFRACSWRKIGGSMPGFGKVALVALMVSLLGQTGCMAPAPSLVHGLSVSKGRPFIIVRTDEAGGWGVLTHPYLCRLSEQRIMLTYNMAGDVVRGTGVAMADWPAYTDDNGETWQFGDPIAWADGPPPHATAATKGDTITSHYGYCFGCAALDSGLRVATERRALAGRQSGTILRNKGVWSRDGWTWHGPREVLYEMVDPIREMYVSPRAVQLDDGGLLCVAYGSPKKEANNKYETYVLRSDDEGSTYQFLSVVATPRDAPWGNDGPCEPALERLSDGSLFCMIRTGSPEGAHGGKVWKAFASDMLQAWSWDDGKTWELRRTSKPGVMPALLEMSNGVLVCAFGRPGNNLMFSLNGGRTWIRELPLSPADVRTSGYVDIMEVDPGRLLAVYDAWDTPPASVWLWEPPAPVCAVWGVFVDVSRRGH